MPRGVAAPQTSCASSAWAALALGLVALALTYSRAGWMGFAAAFAFLLATRVRHGVGGGAPIVVAGLARGRAALQRASRPERGLYAPLDLADRAADRRPVSAHRRGPFNFSRLYALVRAPDGDPTAFHAHSLYLTFFAEFGIVGLATVGWTLWRFAVELRRRVAGAPARTAFLALGVAAGLVGVAVQGLIDTVSVVIFGLWMPMMGLALAAAKRRRARARAARPNSALRSIGRCRAAPSRRSAACNPQPPKAPTPSPAARPTAAATPLVLKITRQRNRPRPVHLIQQVHNRIDYDLLASSYESKGPQARPRAPSFRTRA